MNSYVSKFVQLLGKNFEKKNFDEVLSNFPMCTKILYPIPQYSCFSLTFFVISVIIDVALCVCVSVCIFRVPLIWLLVYHSTLAQSTGCLLLWHGVDWEINMIIVYISPGGCGVHVACVCTA